MTEQPYASPSTILVIDSLKNARDALTYTFTHDLKIPQERIHNADNNLEGLTRLRETKQVTTEAPLILITDHQPPKLDSITMLTQMNSESLLSADTYVIMLSSNTQIRGIQELIDQGIIRTHLPKPVDPDDLVRAIQGYEYDYFCRNPKASN